MKKIVILFSFLLLLFSLNIQSFASDAIIVDNPKEQQKKLSEIGFKILNANQIPYRMIFIYDIKKTINAVTYTSSREIVMYRGLYNMLDSEDEIAAILCHEIAHAVESYKGAFRGAFTNVAYAFNPKKFETKADRIAIDYMVKAGYNPVAAIIAENKIGAQKRFDVFSTHPLTSRRLMYEYEYIYNKYPYFLVNNPYKDNIYYQNFLLTSYDNRQKLKSKIQNKSTRKVNYL